MVFALSLSADHNLRKVTVQIPTIQNGADCRFGVKKCGVPWLRFLRDEGDILHAETESAQRDAGQAYTRQAEMRLEWEVWTVPNL